MIQIDETVMIVILKIEIKTNKAVMTVILKTENKTDNGCESESVALIT